MSWEVKTYDRQQAVELGYIEDLGSDEGSYFGLQVWWQNVDWVDAVPDYVTVVLHDGEIVYVLPDSQVRQ